MMALFNRLYFASYSCSLLMVLMLLVPQTALAKISAGSVVNLSGRASVMSANGNIRNIKKGSKLYANETITTADHSNVRIKLRDKSYIMVRPNSRFIIEDLQYKKKKSDKGYFSLLKGGFRAVSGLIRNKKQYRYRTRIATIGIRGTDFSVRICNSDCFDIDPVPENGLFMEVTDKTVVVTNKAGEFKYNAGQFVYIPDGLSPPVSLPGRPNVFVQSPIPAADPESCPE